ncbi:MAG: hypothetical protein LJE65_16955 [Desulfobacteraceae bacterium]|nr:hypothetical protein [Desulfobacteraceae bacterium]
MSAPQLTHKNRYTFGDYLYWTLLLSVPFVSAIISAWRTSVPLVFGYLAILVAMSVALIRFFCIRCPHYGNGKRNRTQCIFQWGIPALFEKRQGPYTKVELGLTIAAGAVIVLLPLTWLRAHLPLLLVYCLSVAVIAATLRRFECTRCIHGHCPSHCAPFGSEDPETAEGTQI